MIKLMELLKSVMKTNNEHTVNNPPNFIISLAENLCAKSHLFCDFMEEIVR